MWTRWTFLQDSQEILGLARLVGFWGLLLAKGTTRTVSPTMEDPRTHLLFVEFVDFVKIVGFVVQVNQVVQVEKVSQVGRVGVVGRVGEAAQRRPRSGGEIGVEMVEP
jgi:hypothetical protein